MKTLIEGRDGAKFTYNPQVLVEMREHYDITVTEFADLCGWANTRQYDLEGAGSHSLQLKTVLTIYYVLGILEGRSCKTKG